MSILDIFKRGGRVEKGTGDYGPFYSENIWRDWLDGNVSNNNAIDPYRQIAVVYSCIDKIATNISMTRFAIQQNDEDVENNNLTRLFDSPYPGVSGNRMWREIVSNLELRGRAYLVFQEYIGGVPVMMWVPNSEHIKTVTGKDGKPERYIYGSGGDKITIPAEDVLFFNYYDPDRPLGGMSPLQALSNEIDLQWYANGYNINFFKKGGMLKGFFNKKTPGRMSPDQQKELGKRIENEGGGFKNAHKMPVLNDVEWQQIGLAQKDIEFSELMQETADRIYQAFGVPKSLFGFTDTTFNNMSEAKKHFWNQTLLPKMRNIESTLQEGFFKRFAPKFEGKFATWEIPELQVDLHTAATTAKVFYDMGVPFAVINERMGLEFPEDIELIDRTPINPFLMPPEEDEDEAEEDVAASATVDREKIYQEEKIARRVQREKDSVFDFALQKRDHVASIKVMDKYEAQMLPLVKRFWSDVSKEVHELIVGKKDIMLTPEQLATIGNEVESADWLKLLLADVSPIQRKIFLNGMRRTYWGMGVNFNLPPERALTYLAQRGLILRGTVDKVKDEIIEALEEGKTSKELAKEISKIVDNKKHDAQNIARTETTAAYNHGRVDGMKELGIKKKMWINAGDDKVRPEHEINGEIRLIDDTFSNGQPLPGEGPASLVCNCRCTVGSVLE